MTRIHITLVNFFVAESPGIPRVAMTSKVIDAVDTPAVEAVIVDTLVVVFFTSTAGEP